MSNLRGTLVALLVIGSFGLVGVRDSWAFEPVSFDGKYTRWDQSEISFVVDPTGSDDFVDGCDQAGPCVDSGDAIRQAFLSWSQVPGVDLSFREETVDASDLSPAASMNRKNVISFVERGWTSQSFSPPTSALAVTISTYKVSSGEIIDADIVFNGEHFSWAVIDSPEEETGYAVDVENIAAHEIGHLIGLGHSSEDYFESSTDLYEATMFFASGPGETFRRSLANDDISGVQNLYPSVEPDEPNIDVLEPNTIDARASSLATLRIVGERFDANASAVIALPNAYGDIAGKIIAISDTELTAVFDVYGVPSGEYDVIVANSYNRTDRLDNALSITGGTAGYLDDSGNPQGQMQSSGGGCQIGQGPHPTSSGLLLVLIPLLLIAGARREFLIKVRVQREGEQRPPC